MFPSLFVGFVALSLLTGAFAPIWFIPLWIYIIIIFVSSSYMNRDLTVGATSVAAALIMLTGY
jgi:hypothetical protein